MASLSVPTFPKGMSVSKSSSASLNKYRNRVKVFNTEQFTHFVEQNLDRNRGFPVEIIPRLDPSGWHVLKVIMVHNDCELRCWAHSKESETDEPMCTIMDIDVKDFLQGHDPSHIASIMGATEDDYADPPDMADPDDQLPEDGG